MERLIELLRERGYKIKDGEWPASIAEEARYDFIFHNGTLYDSDLRGDREEVPMSEIAKLLDNSV